MITHTLTIDGREISLSDLEMIFENICADIRRMDVEFYWKDAICYEIPYICAEQINDIQSAIVFYVGGKCGIHMYNDHGTLCASIVNGGYYQNIGA